MGLLEDLRVARTSLVDRVLQGNGSKVGLCRSVVFVLFGVFCLLVWVVGTQAHVYQVCVMVAARRAP